MNADLSEGRGRGHWQRILQEEFGDSPYWSAIIWCPGCGRVLALQRGHMISPTGQITPSVGHPLDYPPCSWHVLPRLIGWGDCPNPKPLPTHPCARCGTKGRQFSGWGTWNGNGIICPKCIGEIHGHAAR